jgi:hypothetical protein
VQFHLIMVQWLRPLIANTVQLYRFQNWSRVCGERMGGVSAAAAMYSKAFVQLSTSLCLLAPVHALGVAFMVPMLHWQLQKRW